MALLCLLPLLVPWLPHEEDNVSWHGKPVAPAAVVRINGRFARPIDLRVSMRVTGYVLETKDGQTRWSYLSVTDQPRPKKDDDDD